MGLTRPMRRPTIEPTIDRNLIKFLDLIRRNNISSVSDIRSIDFALKAQFLALDSILDITTGDPMGDLKQDADLYNYLKSSASTMPAAVLVGSVPFPQNFLHIPLIAKRVYATSEPLRMKLGSENS